MSERTGTENESEELVAFRKQWLAELRQRRAGSIDTSSTADPSQLTSSSVVPPNEAPTESDYEINTKQQFPHTEIAHPKTDVLTRHAANSAYTSQGLKKALEVYKLAITSESTGNYEEALSLYRRAFRLDSNVDKAYRREELRLASVSEPHVPSRHHHKPSNHSRTEEIIELLEKTSISHPALTTNDSITKIVSSFPHDLGYEPEDDKENVPLRVIPDELLVLTLSFLDPTSIERFAAVNRKTRILSLDPSIWKDLVQRTYVPPQVPDDLSVELLAEQYASDYRRLYIEYPRVRLDGVYIAVCHYVRHGMGESAWIHVDHLITYHRYLRFFPDGTVLSLLANEEMEPQSVIPSLLPSLRMKGLYIGTWYLEGKSVIIQDLTDPSGHNMRYTFRMTLSLRSKPMGRWNKLDFVGYDSINIETGEVVPLPMKHERGYWFSKVRSYLV